MKRFPISVCLLSAMLLLVTASPSVCAHSHSIDDRLVSGADTEERMLAIAAHLKTEDSQDVQCELGSEMVRIADEIQDQLRRADSETIAKITDLVAKPPREGDAKCVTYDAAVVTQLFGHRARAAAPALERALAAAEADEKRRATPAVFEFGWWRPSLTRVLRDALSAVADDPRP